MRGVGMNKNKALIISFLTLSLLMLVLFNSYGQKFSEWKGSFETEEGVSIVMNPREPIYGEDILWIKEELVIGVAEGREEYMFYQIRDIAVDNDGLIYVVEGRSAHIRVFDKNGKYIRTIGRKGQGPGEFQMPCYAQVISQNELMIHDYAAFRLTFFSLRGEYLRQKSTAETRIPFIPLKMPEKGYLVVITAGAPPPTGGKQLRIYDSDLELVKTIAIEERDMRKLFDIGKPTWYGDVSPSGKIVWGDSSEYVLQVLDQEGKLIKKIVKEYDPVKIPEEDKEEYKKQFAVAIQRGVGIHFRSHYPAFSEIVVDDEERIFVQTYERIRGSDEHFYFDVFDPEGKYLAKVPIRVNLNRISVWKKKKLYTVEEDEGGYLYVKRHKATWKF